MPTSPPLELGSTFREVTPFPPAIAARLSSDRDEITLDSDTRVSVVCIVYRDTFFMGNREFASGSLYSRSSYTLQCTMRFARIRIYQVILQISKILFKGKSDKLGWLDGVKGSYRQWFLRQQLIPFIRLGFHAFIILLRYWISNDLNQIIFKYINKNNWKIFFFSR